MFHYLKAAHRLPFLPLFVGLIAGGCASTNSTTTLDETPTTEAVLLLATDKYELHLKDGHVFYLHDGVVDEVTEYKQMRELYRREGVSPLPDKVDTGHTTILGWRDQECVRAGMACGIEPAFPARDMVRIRLQIP